MFTLMPPFTTNFTYVTKIDLNSSSNSSAGRIYLGINELTLVACQVAARWIYMQR